MKTMFHITQRVLTVVAVAVFVIPVITGSSQTPVSAGGGRVFEMDIIPCGPTSASDGCGSNPGASDPFNAGKVWVNRDGKVKVELKGAAPSTTYVVFVSNWVTGGRAQSQFLGTGPAFCGEGSISIGTITTGRRGNFHGSITTPSGTPFVFPAGTKLGQPNFAFNNPDCVQTQFTTGFAIP